MRVTNLIQAWTTAFPSPDCDGEQAADDGGAYKGR